MPEKKVKDAPQICRARLAELLETNYRRVNVPRFVESDPVQFPRRYSRLQDIEVAGVLCATIAWGRRASILASCRRMLEEMGASPYDYLMNADIARLPLEGPAVHRTFSQRDRVFFLEGLRGIYRRYGSLEDVFAPRERENGLWEGIGRFRAEMLTAPHETSSQRHISCPQKNSACKRLHLFLRWMVRRDGVVDMGVWKTIDPAALSIPLDVHVGNVSRRLGLLSRKADDRRAVEELDALLRTFDPYDPVKYDYALFGLGESGFFKD